LSVLQSN